MQTEVCIRIINEKMNKIFLVRWVFDVPAIIAFGFRRYERNSKSPFLRPPVPWLAFRRVQASLHGQTGVNGVVVSFPLRSLRAGLEAHTKSSHKQGTRKAWQGFSCNKIEQKISCASRVVI